MISVTSKGDYKKTSNALKNMRSGDLYVDLNRYGEMGVQALQAATPIDTSLTSHSWGYRVIKEGRHIGIEWYNNNTGRGKLVQTEDTGVYVEPLRSPIVILIEYGHATGTGAFMAARPFVNSTMQPIFDEISDAVWEKVKS